MRRSLNLPLVLALALVTAVLYEPVRASDCVAHRFADLGRKAATIALVPSASAPEASGRAHVRFTEEGRLVLIEARNLPDPPGLRPEYLTYVAWAIPQDGAPVAIGELRADGEKARLEGLVKPKSFGVIVTAEPYFAASKPSAAVVLRSRVEGKLAERLPTVEVGCTLAAADRYAFGRDADDMALLLQAESNTSPELVQARNAHRIAELAGADRLARAPFDDASRKLVEAEELQARKPGSNEVISQAIASVATADMAYVAALAVQEQELTPGVPASALRAERARLQRELEAERVAMQQEVAAAAKEQDAQRATEQAERRAQLLTQLTEVLEAQDTERGLVVNVSDVGFDPGRFVLNPPAQTMLAQVAGIVLAHPDLMLDIEGHTDNTGSTTDNLSLSEKRAGAVRDFLLTQGVAAGAMTARGYGSSHPVASNETEDGRRANRRISCVISGGEIPLTAEREAASDSETAAHEVNTGTRDRTRGSGTPAKPGSDR